MADPKATKIVRGYKDLLIIAKKMLFELHKSRCDNCGSKSNLIIHHLKYPARSFDDLQVLCTKCHGGGGGKGRGGPGKKIDVRVFLDPFIVKRIDECIRHGNFGTNRSEVIRNLLRDWVRGMLK